MLACWKRWCLGAAALCMAMGAGLESTAFAQAVPPAPPAQVADGAAAVAQTPQPLLDAVARHLGVPATRLEAAVRSAELERWNAFASAHHVPEERDKEMRERIQNEPLELGVRFRNGGRRTLLTAAAGYLGLSETQLMAELRGGKSLADVAQARGKSTDGLKAAVLAAAKTELDGKVQSGTMTPQARDQALTKIQGHLDQLIAHRFRAPAQSGTKSLLAG